MVEPSELAAFYKVIKWADKMGFVEKYKALVFPKNRIYVLGSSGVGKSMFIRALREPGPVPIKVHERTEFNIDFTFKFKEKFFRITDSVGQTDRNTSIREIFKDASSKFGKTYHGKFAIILVVSYGYHVTPGSKGSAFNSDGSINEEFLKKRRDIEIKDAMKALDYFEGNKDCAFVVTLLNKKDLWKDREDEVLDYYSKGEFFEKVVSNLPGDKIFVPFCGAIQRFYDNKEYNYSSNLDDNDRMELRDDFIRILEESISAF